jgi:acyl carrier protein
VQIKNEAQVINLLNNLLGQINKNSNEVNLSETLDSLDRLFIVSNFEEVTKIDLNDLLIDPSAWKNLKTLSERIIEKILHES